MLLRFDLSKVNPVFMSHVLQSNYVQNILKTKNTGTTVNHVNVKDIVNLRIFVPPIEIQNQFADFVKQVDKSKFMLKKHIEDTKSLQQAIINKCFEANDDV